MNLVKTCLDPTPLDSRGLEIMSDFGKAKREGDRRDRAMPEKSPKENGALDPVELSQRSIRAPPPKEN